jgi:hypothetical protein
MGATLVAELKAKHQSTERRLQRLEEQQTQMLMIGSTRLAQEVHAAWRDAMLEQGRQVPPERMHWDSLSALDKALDHFIAERLASLMVQAMGGAPTESPQEDAPQGPPQDIILVATLLVCFILILEEKK